MRVFIFLLATVAAQQVLAQFDYDEAREILNNNQAKWNDNGFAEYNITYSLDCYCADKLTVPITAIVRNGRIEGISPEVSNPDAIPNADNMFYIVDTALTYEFNIRKITYDEELGYPNLVEYNAETNDIYIETHKFEVTKLTAQDLKEEPKEIPESPEDNLDAAPEEIQSIPAPGQTLPDTGVDTGSVGSVLTGRKLFQTSTDGNGFVSDQREIRPGKTSQ
eukprot:g6869.t1